MGCPLNRADKKLVGKGTDTIKLVPGSYKSKLVRVEPATGWVPGAGYELIFEVKVAEDKNVERKTVFSSNVMNTRTKKFIDYLAENGILFDDFEDLIGLQETLYFAYEDVNGRKFLNVYKREFIGFGEDVQ